MAHVMKKGDCNGWSYTLNRNFENKYIICRQRTMTAIAMEEYALAPGASICIQVPTYLPITFMTDLLNRKVYFD